MTTTSHHPITTTTSEQWGHTVPALSLVTERHQAALGQLELAQKNRTPLAILIAEGKFEANHVLGAFLSNVADDATVVRLTRPYEGVTDAMREITRAIGFDPKDLKVADLDNILEMFLEFQRKHHRRTFLCIEQANMQSRWLLEHMRELIDLEAVGKYGLMVILSGQSQLAEVLEQEPPDRLRARAGRIIRLEPFSLAETSEFLRRRVEASGVADISQLFHFDAINRIHTLCGGVPDLVGTLCFKCLQLSNKQQSRTVTEDLVEQASALLWQKPGVDADGSVESLPEIASFARFREKLVISHKGKHVMDFALRRGRFLIGRADFADICLSSKHVSRRHALIVKSATDVSILDLGSTNGTYVNGVRFNGDETIQVGDIITVGDCRIEFTYDDG